MDYESVLSWIVNWILMPAAIGYVIGKILVFIGVDDHVPTGFLERYSDADRLSKPCDEDQS